MPNALNRLVVAIFVICGWATSSGATPVNVNNVFDVLVNNSINNENIRSGLGLYFGARSVIPNGQNGTTGVGQSTNTLTGQVINKTLGFLGNTAFPNEVSTGAGNGSVPFNAGLLGSWTLTYTNGSNITTVTTPSLAGVAPAAFPTNLTVSSGTNPTFTWTNPPGNYLQSVELFDLNILTLQGGIDQVFTQALPANSTSFTVPTALLGGLTLDPTHGYFLEIDESQLRDPMQPRSIANTASLSRTFTATFKPVPTGGPPVTYLPLVDPNGVYHYDMTVIAGQTYFIDPSVASGYVYQIGQGDPNFACVMFPNLQANPYELAWGSGETAFVNGAQQFCFPDVGGVSEFTVTDIDLADGLDPSNTSAFPTGLNFEGDGTFTGTQTPLVTAVVPEPTSLTLLGTGLLGFAWFRRRRFLADC